MLKAWNGQAIVFPQSHIIRGNDWRHYIWPGMGTDRCLPGTHIRHCGQWLQCISGHLLFAVLGAWVYGLVQEKLPH
jgi:hypothetical protein